mmetsp:Transcript_47134/g.106795  ORF Transcript_47134/g.106795 Transcript_47134/m.106795 type:complete len:215 (+) Transcript_47134:1475-2119(+)
MVLGSVLLVRNGIISFVPVMSPDDAQAQIVVFSTVLLMALVAQVGLWPWKNVQLNVVDSGLVSLVMTIVSCAAGNAPASPNRDTFTGVMVALFVVALVLAIAPTLHGLFLVITKADSKPVQIPDYLIHELRGSCRVLRNLDVVEFEQFMIQIGPFGRKAMGEFNGVVTHEFGVGKCRSLSASRLTFEATRKLRTRSASVVGDEFLVEVPTSVSL